MKGKTILTLSLVAIVLLFVGACGPSEQEHEYLDTARAVAEETPLPAWYCPVHGIIGEPGDIKVEIVGYDTASGEPVLNISCEVNCSKFYFWDLSWGLFFLEHGQQVFHLGVSKVIGFYCDGEPWFLEDIPLSILTDNTVTKYWR